jgi:hypothetical protein
MGASQGMKCCLFYNNIRPMKTRFYGKSPQIALEEELQQKVDVVPKNVTVHTLGRSFR